jgi:hypothetical protein
MPKEVPKVIANPDKATKKLTACLKGLKLFDKKNKVCLKDRITKTPEITAKISECSDLLEMHHLFQQTAITTMPAQASLPATRPSHEVTEQDLMNSYGSFL